MIIPSIWLKSYKYGQTFGDLFLKSYIYGQTLGYIFYLTNLRWYRPCRREKWAVMANQVARQTENCNDNDNDDADAPVSWFDYLI